MRGQLKAMGLSIDWEREFATCNPDYYVHQQRLFLDFLKKKLAYRKTAKVNWDPVENTVLANEQVIDGRGWRSGAVVEQRDLTQWFFKITAYAEELLQALDGLQAKWPDFVCTQQRNWIGKSTGANMQFALEGGKLPKKLATLEVFTTRHDTIFGASFMAISPEHPLAAHLAQKNKELAAFIEECRKIGTTEEALAKAEKKGFDTGIVAVHPFKPDVKLPVYVANFIVMGYGTGAIFGCPGHDQRDLDFARKYGRPVVPVVLPPGADAEHLQHRRRGLRRRRHHDQLRVPRRAHHRGGQGQDRGPAGGARHRRAQGQLPHARLAAVAPALLGLPDPGHPLRDGRHRAGAGRGAAGEAAGGRHLRQAGQPARPPPDLEAREVPQVRRAGGARDRHHGHLRRQLLVPVPLHRPARRRRRPTRRR